MLAKRCLEMATSATYMAKRKRCWLRSAISGTVESRATISGRKD